MRVGTPKYLFVCMSIIVFDLVVGGSLPVKFSSGDR